MTLIEALIFVILSGVLLAVGPFLAGKWGTVGWLIGGVPVGLFWSWVMFGAARSIVIEFRHTLRPRRQNKCGPRDYVLIDSTPSKATFRCGCGDFYPIALFGIHAFCGGRS
jgi:hypothetical protein